jgi:hypothetical protein
VVDVGIPGSYKKLIERRLIEKSLIETSLIEKSLIETPDGLSLPLIKGG